MVTLRELFFPELRGLSLAIILFVIGMAVWLNRFLVRKMAESQPPESIGAQAPQA